ncbi:MAG TPA: NADP-dependent oxidoreductase [Acidimicrobiales bacterium]|nr:NADP-dependent oxidoreductase [Acidimicrobiales bacterium]
MAPNDDRNRRLVLAQRPSGMVDESTVRLESGPVPEPAPGQALVRVRYLSIDPTIRTWMNDAPGYVPPIGLGEVIRSAGIGEVVRSQSDRFALGETVYGMTGWQDYALAGDGAGGFEILPPGIDPPTALNIFGITGMTAYFGLIDVGRVQAGDTVVVSGAAGATGSVVGQIARIKDAKKVVGIAGSEQKCDWLVNELGFHAAVNYHTDDVAARLAELCPGGIDLYFDNVGGELLDICLAQLALRGRVVLCGAISTYNSPGRVPGPSNYRNLIIKRGRMEGFLILDYLDRFPEAQLQMAVWAAEGRIKHKEQLVKGLERAPEALNLLFTGGNTGKVIVQV